MDKLDLQESHRSKKQEEVYKQIARDGVCPFCRKNFDKYHKNKILKENDSWLVTQNDTPYEGTKYHFLFVFTGKHITTPDEMSSEDLMNLFDLIEWVNKKFKIKSGGFFMRYGGKGNGSSVRHLHAHVVVGKSREKTDDKIKVKLGYF